MLKEIIKKKIESVHENPKEEVFRRRKEKYEILKKRIRSNSYPSYEEFEKLVQSLEK